MASNQTERLGLSDWSAQDALTMAEFNQDHRRLEERLGYLAAEPILEVTLSADAAVVSLDMSGVDWGRYDSVILDADLTLSASERILLRVNGSTSTEQHMCYKYYDSSGYFHTTGYLATLSGKRRSRVCFEVMGDPGYTVNLTFRNHNYPMGWGHYYNKAYTAISTLSLSPSDSSATLKAGGTVKLWGVRG